MASDPAPKQSYTMVCGGLDGGVMYLMCREEVRPHLTAGNPVARAGGEFNKN
jgi:hypothetical protein